MEGFDDGGVAFGDDGGNNERKLGSFFSFVVSTFFLGVLLTFTVCDESTIAAGGS